jgi:hypothetical protein
MSPDSLKKNLASLTEDRDRLNTQIDEIEQNLALYATAIKLRPADIPATWEPILDDSGVLKGWMDPDFAYKAMHL